jgi:hypothetical protein
MPVEVRELIIRATLTDSDRDTDNTHSTSVSTMENQEQLIARCVQQVLHILDKNKAR